MAKKYMILKSFKYKDKDGRVVLAERNKRDNESGSILTNEKGYRIHNIMELPKEALDVAKAVKKASGKSPIEEVDE